MVTIEEAAARLKRLAMATSFQILPEAGDLDVPEDVWRKHSVVIHPTFSPMLAAQMESALLRAYDTLEGVEHNCQGCGAPRPATRCVCDYCGRKS